MNSNWSYSLETFNLGQNRQFFVPCGLEIWRITSKNNRAPLLCCFKLCASFQSHGWIQTGVTARNAQLWCFGGFFQLFDLEIWQITLKNNRAPLLSNIKLCASFHPHMSIKTGVTVRKWLNWVLTSVPLTFDVWPRHFAWHLLLSLVITPDDFMMIRWWEHSLQGMTDGHTDGPTDGQMDWAILRAAWSQLKSAVGITVWILLGSVDSRSSHTGSGVQTSLCCLLSIHNHSFAHLRIERQCRCK